MESVKTRFTGYDQSDRIDLESKTKSNFKSTDLIFDLNIIKLLN